MSSAPLDLPKCRWCSTANQVVYHAPCPKVRSIEYYPNGTVKKVEFHPVTNIIWGDDG